MTNVALDDVDQSHIAPLNCRLLRTITIAPEVRASGLIVTLPDSLEHDEAFVLKITGLKTNPDMNGDVDEQTRPSQLKRAGSSTTSTFPDNSRSL